MRTFLIGLLALALAGCGPSGENPGNAIKVTGKVVTADGQPVRFADLIFTPTQRGLMSAHAKTGADGTFTPKTGANEDGIIPGAYKVSVEPMRNPAATPVPKKYHSDETTDLKITVGGGDKEITVTLP